MDAVLKAAKPTTLDTVLNMEEEAGLEATVLMVVAALCSVPVEVAMVVQTEKQAVKVGHGEHTRQALEPMAGLWVITMEMLATTTHLVAVMEAAAGVVMVYKAVKVATADSLEAVEAAVENRQVQGAQAVTAHWAS